RQPGVLSVAITPRAVRMSIRKKLLALVAGVALLVGAFSALYSSLSNRQVLRDQMVKRGRYIAANLAYNSKYGLLTEDKQLLNQLLEGAMAAGGGQSSDVVGAMIRDARGLVLAQRGAGIKDLPLRAAAQLEEKDAVTEAGDEVILFRAPVTTRASGPSSDVAAELGLAATAGRVVEDQKGGV